MFICYVLDLCLGGDCIESAGYGLFYRVAAPVIYHNYVINPIRPIKAWKSRIYKIPDGLSIRNIYR